MKITQQMHSALNTLCRSTIQTTVLFRPIVYLSPFDFSITRTSITKNQPSFSPKTSLAKIPQGKPVITTTKYTHTDMP